MRHSKLPGDGKRVVIPLMQVARAPDMGRGKNDRPPSIEKVMVVLKCILETLVQISAKAGLFGAQVLQTLVFKFAELVNNVLLKKSFPKMKNVAETIGLDVIVLLEAVVLWVISGVQKRARVFEECH